MGGGNRMIISDIKIESLSANGFSHSAEGIHQIKFLPFLSVVQATEGSYDIRIGNSPTFSTGENGIFIAPANALQEITHHDGKEGNMQAHWVFIDAIVNGEYRFDEIFTFPVILDAAYNEEISMLTEKIRSPKNIFQKKQAAYRLLEILAAEGRERKNGLHPIHTKIETFVKSHFMEDIRAEDLAKHLFCSVPQVFRYTHKYFGLSPANYINGIRLQQAEIKLRTSNKTVTEIAFSCGFSDSAYFSKLFKKNYAQSPLRYRREHFEKID